MLPKRLLLWALILSVTFCLPEIVAAQNLRELARKQSAQNPGVPLIQPAPPADLLPKSIEELATESDVVLRARLSKTSSYLSRNEDRVLTDYRIQQPRVIAGRLPTMTAQIPGQGVQLILTVYGGDLMVEGVSVRGIDNNREAIEDGGQYLLFLKKARGGQPGQYEIYYGGIFEVVDGKRVDPLLRAADRVFKGAEKAPLNEMVKRIQAAKRPR